MEVTAILGAFGLAYLIYCFGVVVGRNRAETKNLAGPPALPRPLPEDVRTQVQDLLATRKKIAAIKLVREATGLGLKDARNFVEAMKRA